MHGQHGTGGHGRGLGNSGRPCPGLPRGRHHLPSDLV